MADLSPAAQAVLDAANSCNFYGPDDCLNESRWIAAAALRAAADQVLPQKEEPSTDPMKPNVSFGYSWTVWETEQYLRLQFLAIAAELEALPD